MSIELNIKGGYSPDGGYKTSFSTKLDGSSIEFIYCINAMIETIAQEYIAHQVFKPKELKNIILDLAGEAVDKGAKKAEARTDGAHLLH